MDESDDIQSVEYEEIESDELRTGQGELVQVAQTREGTAMVHQPRLQQVRRGAVEVRADHENPSVIPWGFWGGLLVVIVSILLIVSAQSVYSLWDLVWSLAAIAVGLLLWRFGKRDAMEETRILEIDLERQQLMWLTDRKEQGGVTLEFDEIVEVVFGMTAYPVSDPDDVKVDAFTVLLRDARDELVPVIEATPNKEEAHEVAKFLAGQLEQNITYVGRGIK